MFAWKFHANFIKDSPIPTIVIAVNSTDKPPLSRRNAMKLLFCCAAGSAVNGFWIEPGRLSVTRADISCARLPDALDGLRVGLMSDIHLNVDELTERRNIQLQLSGHTHGGQCRVPFVSYTPAKVAYGRKYIHGAFERGDSRLFVTRGLGTVGLRVRFACPPEVAVLTLLTV